MKSIAILVVIVLLSVGLQAKHIPGHEDAERARRQFFGSQNAQNIQNNQFSATDSGARPVDDDAAAAASDVSQVEGGRGKLELSGESNSFSQGQVRKTKFHSVDGAVQGFSKQASVVSGSSTSFTGQSGLSQEGQEISGTRVNGGFRKNQLVQNLDSSLAQSGVVESSQRIRNNQLNQASVVSSNVESAVSGQFGEVQQTGFVSRKNKINQASVVSTGAVEQTGFEQQQVNRNRVNSGNFEASRFSPQAGESEVVSGQRIRNNQQVVSQQNSQVSSGFEQQSGQVVSGQKIVKHKKIQQQQSTLVNVESEQVNSQVSGHRFANKNTVNNQAIVSNEASQVNSEVLNGQVLSGQRIRNKLVNNQASNVESAVSGEVQQSGFVSRKNKNNHGAVVIEQSGFESTQGQHVNRNRVVSGNTRKANFESSQESEVVSGQRIRNNNQATVISGSNQFNSEVTEAQESGVQSFRGGINPNVVSGHRHVRPFEGRFGQGAAGFEGRFGQGAAGFEGRFGQGPAGFQGGFGQGGFGARAGPVLMEARQGHFGGRRPFFSEVSSDNFGKLGNTGNFF